MTRFGVYVYTMKRTMKIEKILAAIEALYEVLDSGLSDAQRALVLDQIGALKMLRNGIETSFLRIVAKG